VQRAKHRGLAAQISLGDITAIAEPDASFDGVFVFGILHHVPAWRAALGELARVLRPGGVLLVEEIHGTAVRIEDRVLGTSHPPDAAFNWFEFRGALASAGLAIAAETGFLCGAMRSFAAVKPTGAA
jgi:ubiquinone/menaquinone biosynthesis C-methylase UbiE